MTPGVEVEARLTRRNGGRIDLTSGQQPPLSNGTIEGRDQERVEKLALESHQTNFNQFNNMPAFFFSGIRRKSKGWQSSSDTNHSTDVS